MYSLGGLFVDISNLAVNNKKGIFSVVDGGGGGRTAAAVAPLAHFSARSSRAINYENDVCICIMTFSVVLYCSPLKLFRYFVENGSPLAVSIFATESFV